MEAQRRWDAYTEAKEETFRLTDKPRTPWTIIKSDDKLRARLEVIRLILSSVGYTGKSAHAIGQVDERIVASAGRIYQALPSSSEEDTRNGI